MGNTETMKGMGRASRVNVEQKEVEIAEAISEALLRSAHGCARKWQKLEQNALDGADFVRDVFDSYPGVGVRCVARARITALTVSGAIDCPLCHSKRPSSIGIAKTTTNRMYPKATPQ